MNILQRILPSAMVPSDLIDPIGVVAILTIFLALAEVTKRLVWFVVVAGWLLIAVRIALVVFR